jgi:hypothetical protein
MKIDIVFKQNKPLYQLQDDFAVFGEGRPCANGGCPAVVPFLDDPPDVELDRNWQYYLIAINHGMTLSSISRLLHYTTAFTNRIGTGNKGDPRRNYVLGESLDAPKNPYTDKFRSCNLNTHIGWDDGTWMYPLAMDGELPPPLKPNKKYPRSIQEITPSDYLITPWDNPEMFVVCNNVSWKVGPKRLAYGPFAHGLKRSYRDDNIYTFFPFVTTYKNVRTPLHWWKKVPAVQNPYRS